MFHALALLACCRAATRRCRCARRPARSPRRCSRATRSIPAPPHYILHAYDHGALARAALAAARAYATIAPGGEPRAPHAGALRSCSSDTGTKPPPAIRRRGTASVAWASRKPPSVALRDFHSLTWLHYEWTQQGRFSEGRRGAGRRVDEAMAVATRSRTPSAATTTPTARSAAAAGRWRCATTSGSMRARYVIESERWSEMNGQGSFDNIDELFVLGLSAAAAAATATARRWPSRRAAEGLGAGHGRRAARAGVDPAAGARGAGRRSRDGITRRGVRRDGRGGAAAGADAEADRPARIR